MSKKSHQAKCCQRLASQILVQLAMGALSLCGDDIPDDLALATGGITSSFESRMWAPSRRLAIDDVQELLVARELCLNKGHRTALRASNGDICYRSLPLTVF